MKRAIPILLLTLTLCLSSCASSTPVRHLASDAALIQPGQTTLAELHQYLGEPKGSREVSPGVKEYVYSEDIVSFWGKMPVVGKMVDPGGYEMLIVTVKDEVVQNAVFRNFSEKNQQWVKDYNWEEE